MKQLLTRINKSLKDNHFVVVQIFGSAGTGKTILANEVLKRYPNYDIRRIDDLRPLKEGYTDNMIEIIEDSHHIVLHQSRYQRLRNLEQFYTKPKLLRANLIRIIITSYKIELLKELTFYRHIQDYCIDVTTGAMGPELPGDHKGTSIKFMRKWRNVFKRKLKTRPYLITSKPLMIGRCKISKQRFPNEVKQE